MAPGQLCGAPRVATGAKERAKTRAVLAPGYINSKTADKTARLGEINEANRLASSIPMSLSSEPATQKLNLNQPSQAGAPWSTKPHSGAGVARRAGNAGVPAV